MSSTHIVSAVFPDRDSAIAARETLGKEHYRYRWLAVAKPIEHLEHEAGAVAEVHAIENGSDGAFGAIGRFISGQGDSLRRALEDHGVSRDEAVAIDAETPPHGAVLVVHASAERTSEAVSLLAAVGGHVYPHAPAGDPRAATGVAEEAPAYAPNDDGASAGLIADRRRSTADEQPVYALAALTLPPEELAPLQDAVMTRADAVSVAGLGDDLTFRDRPSSQN